MAAREYEEIQRLLEIEPFPEVIDDSSGSEPDPDDVRSTAGAEQEEAARSDSDREIANEEEEDSDGDSKSDTTPGPSKRGRYEVTKSRSKKTLYGKGLYRWTTFVPEPELKADSKNRPESHRPAGLGAAAAVASPYELWSLLFPDSLLNIVVARTNEELVDRDKINEINLPELKALLGLLYFMGVNNHSDKSIQRLWGALGSFVYSLAMKQERFEFLMRFLRFDDKRTRAERSTLDKFARIREIWEPMLKNFAKYYNPHQHCTVDEELLDFNERRSRFDRAPHSKPHECGIKILMINDAMTSYMFNAELSMNTDQETKESHDPALSDRLERLSAPIHGTGRNLTFNRPLASVRLCDRMKKDHSLTIVGPISEKEDEIPREFESPTQAGAAKFAFNDGKVLSSYRPKQDNTVLLLSSYHKDGKTHSITGKPEVVDFWNRTKSGAENFHRHCRRYSVARSTRRWPMRFFFGMLDRAAVNAYILYSLSVENEPKIRADFLEELAIELMKPLVSLSLRRVEDASTRGSMKKMFKIPSTPAEIAWETDCALPRKTRCGLCPRSSDRKTKTVCSRCRVPRCDLHRANVCARCVEDL